MMNFKNIETNVPVFKPLIGKAEIDAAVESLELGWLGMGSYVKKFEDAVTNVCQLKPEEDRHVVAVSTGHAAMHLAFLSMGIGKGDEVITPSFNNVADFQAIRACGAEPVFVDIDDKTLCIDVTKVKELINSRTKCIIGMDYDVFTCDHDALKQISHETNIPILHDAAHSFGSNYKETPIGKQHQYTMFSFDPVKTITCIDGGVIIVKGDKLLKKMHAKRLIGMTQSAKQMYKNERAWSYDVKELGFRYHMPNLHGAIGVSQINKIDEIRKTRQSVCKRYYDNLSKLKWLDAPKGDFDSVNPFLYYVRILNGRRDDLRQHMKTKGVDTGIHWQAGHTFSFLKNCRKGNLDITNKVTEQIISIPLHSKMNNNDVERVIDSITSYNA
jgi:dTDP-4-amino-4,6-dideoxygalactose transaminase